MEEARFIFTTPFNVNVVEVKGKEKVFMEGFISTTDKDLVNDIVTKQCLESMQKQILDRNIKLDVEHEAFRGETVEEKEINKTKVPAGKITDATVRKLEDNRFGLGIKAELNKFRNDYAKVKGNVLERYLDAFSIAFIPTKTAFKTVNGEEIRLLDDVRLLNVALTGNPVNTMALNSKVFMKAIDAVEEYKTEKENNPDIENQLEVKDMEGKKKHSAKWHSCVTKVKKMGGVRSPEAVCTAALGEESYKSLDHTHSIEKQINKIGENMTEEKTEPEAEPKVDEPAAPESEAPAKEPEAPEKPAESSESGDVESKEFKALKEEVAELKKSNAEIKALLEKPVHKAISEPEKKNIEQKEVEPLDTI